MGLVIGYLIKNNEDYECRVSYYPNNYETIFNFSSLQIREYLPTRDFKNIVSVLEKMLNFMKMTSIGTVSSNRGIKVGLTNKGTSQSLICPLQATEGIIKHLEKVDAEPEDDDFMKEDETTDFTLFEVIVINP